MSATFGINWESSLVSDMRGHLCSKCADALTRDSFDVPNIWVYRMLRAREAAAPMEPLYRHAMRITNNAPDVEDLLHTAGQQDSDAARLAHIFSELRV